MPNLCHRGKKKLQQTGDRQLKPVMAGVVDGIMQPVVDTLAHPQLSPLV